MELVELLEALRSAYMTQYEATYEEQKLVFKSVHPEIGFQISGGTFKNLYIVDFAVRNGEETSVIEVTPTDSVYSGNVSVAYKSLTVTFDMVSWDAMAFEMTPGPAQLNGSDAWFDYWTDLQGQRRVEGRYYSEIIHSAALDGAMVYVDFGSARVEAVYELLDVFAQSGVEEVHVRTSR